MLAAAGKKEIYQQLYPLYPGAEIDLPEESYDAMVATGAWGKLDRPLMFRTYPFSEKVALRRYWVRGCRKR